jgi:C4-dicarboxylate transporter DctQ subunit
VGVLKKLDRFLLKAEEYILSYSIILIAVMIIGNVLSRALTGISWAMAPEVSKYAVFLATFIGIGYAARKGRHISMSAFFDLAPPKLKKALAIFIPLLTATILLVLTYYSSLYVVDIYEKGRVTPALQAPEWIMVSFVPVGFFFGSLQFFRNAWINIKEKEIYLGTEQKDYS